MVVTAQSWDWLVIMPFLLMLIMMKVAMDLMEPEAVKEWLPPAIAAAKG